VLVAYGEDHDHTDEGEGTREIIQMTRTFLTYVDVIKMNARPNSWKAPPGIWTRSELRGVKPKPATMMLLNWILCQYTSGLID
jgi:hypothetical protein